MTSTSNKLGDCFEVSGRFILNIHYKENATSWDEDSDYKLVHAIVMNSVTGDPMSHAWLEVGDTAMDLSNGKSALLSREYYYELGKPVHGTICKYTPKEAAEKMLESGHFGPWEIESL